jgi:hypothetical protein
MQLRKVSLDHYNVQAKQRVIINFTASFWADEFHSTHTTVLSKKSEGPHYGTSTKEFQLSKQFHKYNRARSLLQGCHV